MAAKSSKFRERKLSRTNLAGLQAITRRDRKKDESEDKNSFKVYTILSLEDTNELINSNMENIDKKLISFFRLDDPTINLKDGITLDYYVEGVTWAKEQEFSSAKFSGFFTVLHELFENVKEKHFTIQDNIMHFRRYYGGIGLTDIPETGNSDLFSIKEAKKTITYFCTTFFQHYALYEYVFTHTQAEELIGTQVKIETPNAIDGFFAPPLIEAVSESTVDKYKAILPDSEEDQKAAPLEDALTPTEEALELLHHINRNDIQEIFGNTLSEMLPHVQTEITAALQEKEPLIISRIMFLCKINELEDGDSNVLQN